MTLELINFDERYQKVLKDGEFDDILEKHNLSYHQFAKCIELRDGEVYISLCKAKRSKSAGHSRFSENAPPEETERGQPRSDISALDRQIHVENQGEDNARRQIMLQQQVLQERTRQVELLPLKNILNSAALAQNRQSLNAPQQRVVQQKQDSLVKIKLLPSRTILPHFGRRTVHARVSETHNCTIDQIRDASEIRDVSQTQHVPSAERFSEQRKSRYRSNQRARLQSDQLPVDTKLYLGWR